MRRKKISNTREGKRRPCMADEKKNGHGAAVAAKPVKKDKVRLLLADD